VLAPLITFIGDMPLKCKILFHLKRPLFSIVRFSDFQIFMFRRGHELPPKGMCKPKLTCHLRHMQCHKLLVCQLRRKLPELLPVCRLHRKLPESLPVCQLRRMQYRMQMLPFLSSIRINLKVPYV
jgi:hypothetical protein